jgi:hypothetical protein
MEKGALPELPGERMLAAASTYQQHVQLSSRSAC